jgi:hypothetical protein
MKQTYAEKIIAALEVIQGFFIVEVIEPIKLWWEDLTREDLDK